jgi:hypothetical protein
VADLYSDIYGDIYGDVFVPGTGPADGIKVEVDWNRDGDFTGTNENVTRYIRRSEPISSPTAETRAPPDRWSCRVRAGSSSTTATGDSPAATPLPRCTG